MNFVYFGLHHKHIDPQITSDLVCHAFLKNTLQIKCQACLVSIKLNQCCLFCTTGMVLNHIQHLHCHKYAICFFWLTSLGIVPLNQKTVFYKQTHLQSDISQPLAEHMKARGRSGRETHKIMPTNDCENRNVTLPFTEPGHRHQACRLQQTNGEEN